MTEQKKRKHIISLDPTLAAEMCQLQGMESQAHIQLGQAHAQHVDTMDYIRRRKFELHQEAVRIHKLDELPENTEFAVRLSAADQSGVIEYELDPLISLN